MNTRFLLPAFSLVFTSFAFAVAQDTGMAQEAVAPAAAKPDSAAAAQTAIADTAIKPAVDSAAVKAKTPAPPAKAETQVEEEDIVLRGGASPDYRSPRKAMFMSLVIPGWGQFYARSKIKGVAFIAAEVGLFGMREYFNNRGDDWDSKVRSFVDANFSDSSYEAWWSAVRPDTSTNISGIDTSILNEHYRYWQDEKETRTQQYYEMVHKYQQFVQGWKDATPTLEQYLNGDLPDSVGPLPVLGPLPPYRIIVPDPDLTTDTIFGYSADQLEAADLAAKSNDAYRWADNVWFAIMANHICSAIDAALTARHYNRALLGQSQSFLDRLHIESRTLCGVAGLVPVVAARINF